jgi:hypothetical protein
MIRYHIPTYCNIIILIINPYSQIAIPVEFTDTDCCLKLPAIARMDRRWPITDDNKPYGALG